MNIFTKLPRLLLGVLSIPTLFSVTAAQELGNPSDDARTVKVKLVALEQVFIHNRLGANLPNGQLYALESDIIFNDHPYDDFHQDDASVPVDPSKFAPGEVRLRSHKRPRPVVLRVNKGDRLEIDFWNLLPSKMVDNPKEHLGPKDPKKIEFNKVGIQIFGLQWLDCENATRINPGKKRTYKFYAAEEGVFMMMTPNGQSIASSHNDLGLFGAVNVQPQEAEYYRSQITREDLRHATMRVTKDSKAKLDALLEDTKRNFIDGEQFGLPRGVDIRKKEDPEAEGEPEALSDQRSELYKLRLESPDQKIVPKIAEAEIRQGRYLYAKTGQPLIDYTARYPEGHPRAGTPVLDMLQPVEGEDNTFKLVHSDLTALITGPNAGRFPFYLESPSFRENPVTPDRRQPYREFTIMYHISPLTQQAFAPFQDANDPLYNTLQAGKDGFAINYGIAGIGPEIYANRINRGPQGFHGDGVDLKFEEFFLSAWAVGDPAILVDVPASTPVLDPDNPPRATKALYPDDPSNVYHSYMRDHLKFRVLNTGSVAPHVHHQHAHQWLHTPNSDDSHYLDSQMINPGATYTLEMTYNGSGNRNQTVGDSIFHCHFYPHFAQGMWAMWRVHDVFEEGTKLDSLGRPLKGARALPDGEIALGTPIPALVPLPTIGMAPTPAIASLTEDGRRVVVKSEEKDKDGKPVYKNPGFPFFIPGVAGHRAPHPPLDFAWKENDESEPLLITAENADAFNEIGEIDYLDGGLPRHLVLNGEIVREFHTRWDFSKDFALNNEKGKFIKGSLTAIEIPDKGTPVEQAAMKAHATRTHHTHQPNGLPGNFYLNGLPPEPGAPYASPDVDDNGNSNFDARRYKAAVVQTDVVFNKQGWHYPQQRFITLLEDVKDTISGERPPEPFFFRANTGETIEFWHTNLVPAYYELDDFQVRTPTDIIGQHIHLVKFDVTSSDGAANGFNYEDGTFSPDEVRDRVNAINASGGLYHFNEKLAEEGKRSPLKVTPYKDDYGDTLGNPPAGQDWNGAQTTVQRFDTDSLLDNEGEDRTLRTVFTHDHFGPSTHQQVGLYGALLVEPSGSNWIDALTGEQFPSSERSDGGPTSWQSIIETADSGESYREFAIAVADLQLAYEPESKSTRSRTEAVWFSFPGYVPNLLTKQPLPDSGTALAIAALVNNNIQIRIFDSNGRQAVDKGEADLVQGPDLAELKELLAKDPLPSTTAMSVAERAALVEKIMTVSDYTATSERFFKQIIEQLNSGEIPGSLQTAFTRQGAILSKDQLEIAGSGPWTVIKNGVDRFELTQNGNSLDVKTLTIEEGWTDPTYAIWAPIDPTVAQPTPTIISDPGGSGNIGLWVQNYRNEPLDQRVQGDPSTPEKGDQATDPSFAFASIERHEKRLNSQPLPGWPITKGSGFSYPDSPLVPEGVGPYDPYTPLLRAYANDKVEVRTIVGAVDSVHSFRIQGNRWQAEPSYPESGFRDVQGFAISEHFEMIFQLPPADSEGEASADYLYAPSTSTLGLVKGTWGIMRSYRDKQEKLAEVSNNPVGEGNRTSGFYTPPPDAEFQTYAITTKLNPDQNKLIYEINGMKCDSLVLRANAGDWIKITLKNELPATLPDFFLSRPNLVDDPTKTDNPASVNHSANTADPYRTSALAGLHPMMLAYDTTASSGINVGSNPTQTIAPGETKTYLWYAGSIDFKDGERTLTPIEFGGVNLLPSDPLMQQSFGLFGVLVVEPAGSHWEKSEAHSLVAIIKDKDKNPIFTEIIVAGNANPDTPVNASAFAGTEVRFRILNSGNGAPGNVTDSTNMIVVQGHEWQEEPFIKASTVIGDNPLSQAMGTQQITSLESYNLVLPSAGGVNKKKGQYTFFYYPKGDALGTLNVK